MDLLSKLYIVEKNITMMIDRISHRDCIDKINAQYHKMFSHSTNSQYCCLLYVGDTLNRNTVVFNYRKLSGNPWPKIWVVLSKGRFLFEESAHLIPDKYVYSSGK